MGGHCSVGLERRVSSHEVVANGAGAAHLTGGLFWRWFTAFQYDEAAAEAAVGGREADGGVERA